MEVSKDIGERISGMNERMKSYATKEDVANAKIAMQNVILGIMLTVAAYLGDCSPPECRQALRGVYIRHGRAGGLFSSCPRWLTNAANACASFF